MGPRPLCGIQSQKARGLSVKQKSAKRGRYAKVETAIADLGYALGKLPKKEVAELLVQIKNSRVESAEEKGNGKAHQKL